MLKIRVLSWFSPSVPSSFLPCEVCAALHWRWRPNKFPLYDADISLALLPSDEEPARLPAVGGADRRSDGRRNGGTDGRRTFTSLALFRRSGHRRIHRCHESHHYQVRVKIMDTGQSRWIPNSVWRGWNPKEDGTIGGWLSYFILRRSRTYSDVLFHLEKESNVFRWLFLLTCDLKWHLMLVRWLLLPPWPFSGVQYKTVLVALSLLSYLPCRRAIHPSFFPSSSIFSHRRHFRPIPISSNTKSPLSRSCRISPLLDSFCSAIQSFGCMCVSD